MKSKLKAIRKNLAEDLELPEDIVLGSTLVTVTGNYKMHIENAHGIVEYTDTRIKILTKDQLLEINGANLLISSYTQEDINIEGCIDKIIYISRSLR